MLKASEYADRLGSISIDAAWKGLTYFVVEVRRPINSSSKPPMDTLAELLFLAQIDVIQPEGHSHAWRKLASFRDNWLIQPVEYLVKTKNKKPSLITLQDINYIF